MRERERERGGGGERGGAKRKAVGGEREIRGEGDRERKGSHFIQHYNHSIRVVITLTLLVRSIRKQPTRGVVKKRGREERQRAL